MTKCVFLSDSTFFVHLFLHRQIEIDSKFLEAQNIMDYSLLLGVHYRAPRHLRSLMPYNKNVTSDGLGIVAEEGGLLI